MELLLSYSNWNKDIGVKCSEAAHSSSAEEEHARRCLSLASLVSVPPSCFMTGLPSAFPSSLHHLLLDHSSLEKMQATFPKPLLYLLCSMAPRDPLGAPGSPLSPGSEILADPNHFSLFSSQPFLPPWLCWTLYLP